MGDELIQNRGLYLLYQNAYRTWGLKAQMGMVIEEMAELIQAIQKANRKGILTVQDNLVEEFVDVEIMMEQMEVMLSDHLHSFDTMRSNFRMEKLTRLEKMIDRDRGGKVDEN